MSTDPEVTLPPADTPETLPTEPPRVSFSGVHWFLKVLCVYPIVAGHVFAPSSFPKEGFKSRTLRAGVAYSFA